MKWYRAQMRPGGKTYFYSDALNQDIAIGDVIRVMGANRNVINARVCSVMFNEPRYNQSVNGCGVAKETWAMNLDSFEEKWADGITAAATTNFSSVRVASPEDLERKAETRLKANELSTKLDNLIVFAESLKAAAEEIRDLNKFTDN